MNTRSWKLPSPWNRLALTTPIVWPWLSTGAPTCTPAVAASRL